MKVKRTERGWMGHFICADRCRFRRNTLIECGDRKIVISSVGLYYQDDQRGFVHIGSDRYFETMAFHVNSKNTKYYDPDTDRQIHFNSPWSIAELDADDKANIMHETVVDELTERLKNGETFEDTNE